MQPAGLMQQQQHSCALVQTAVYKTLVYKKFPVDPVLPSGNVWGQGSMVTAAKILELLEFPERKEATHLPLQGHWNCLDAEEDSGQRLSWLEVALALELPS